MKNNKHNTNSIIHIVYLCIIVLIIVVFMNIIYKTNAVEKGGFNTTLNEFVDNSMTITVSIICSIIASVIYAHIMNKKSEIERENLKEDIKKISEKVYDEKIDDEVQRISQTISKIYNDTTDMMPSRYYRSADFPNSEFNTFLNRKIVESKKFVYYGESARFTCKRLYKLKDEIPSLKNLKIEIYIVNPACNKIFESNKAFLAIKEKNKNYGEKREWNTIIEEEKMKVLYCLYALKEMMSFLQRVDVFLIDDVPFIDIEMTDDMIALEFFRTRNDYKRYPLTIIYDDKKAYYESYEFYLEWEKEKAMHIKEEDLTVDYIIALGEKAGIKNLTEKKLKECCDKEIFNELERYI
nr:hypothetical protein [uncultured Schaedlerella sp.]